MSFYMGPGQSRLELPDWGSGVSAAQSGVLDESAWIELKEAVPAASKPANLELAKDLASLSVDGGVLIIGVTDKDQVVVESAKALSDRVIQVAATRINPPFFVNTPALPDAERGVHACDHPAQIRERTARWPDDRSSKSLARNS